MYCELQGNAELLVISVFQLDERMTNETTVSWSVPAWRDPLSDVLWLTQELLECVSFYTPNQISLYCQYWCYQNKTCPAVSFSVVMVHDHKAGYSPSKAGIIGCLLKLLNQSFTTLKRCYHCKPVLHISNYSFKSQQFNMRVQFPPNECSNDFRCF